ncbi:hypothetical protein H5T55_02470 [Candidatus Bipolaricaulota bacterium]|nr:hypothetical protein [Candidatus Bipolaricaulota bacterium]
MDNPVRTGARWIMRWSSWVRVDRARLLSLAEKMCDLPLVAWEDRYHFRGEEETTLRYLLCLDALNFCFWPPSGPRGEKWAVPGPEGEKLTGYFALAWALRRAAEEEPSLFSPEVLADATPDRVGAILGEIPLLSWRARALREVGAVLLRFGSAREFFARAGGSCRRLVELVTSHLPLFRDAALYRGREVLFHKRAQILCADLWGTFGGEGPGALRDLDWLTAFADYKLPQLLWAEGALVLHPSLATRLRSLTPLVAGSAEEVELRAATVVAVEELTATLRADGRSVRAFEVDWTLWNLSQDRLPVPHPRVVTPLY